MHSAALGATAAKNEHIELRSEWNDTSASTAGNNNNYSNSNNNTNYLIFRRLCPFHCVCSIAISSYRGTERAKRTARCVCIWTERRNRKWIYNIKKKHHPKPKYTLGAVSLFCTHNCEHQIEMNKKKERKKNILRKTKKSETGECGSCRQRRLCATLVDKIACRVCVCECEWIKWMENTYLPTHSQSQSVLTCTVLHISSSPLLLLLLLTCI